ncbi:arylesterase [Corallincola platygyrae]|uniref:Arylesterase n=1 Tax=Corallincola platygyrae TaxID=1193278 RepID=A0ABW4XKN8_9GAMM
MFRAAFTRTITLLIVLVWLPGYTHAQEKTTIMVVGDSLSAAYGMAMQQGWVHLMSEALTNPKDNQNVNKVDVVNASITGDTSDGGLRRLPALLSKHSPEIVIIELGGNDGLRGFDLAHTERQLSQMIELSQQAGATPLLVEIMLPPNYGRRYTQAFQSIYPRLADKYKITLVPSFLPAVAEDPQLMQADGIHPSAEAQPIISSHMLPYVQAALAP